MTIAAFAGGKRFGVVRNLGLNSLNYQPDPAGSDSGIRLALLVDFIFGRLEQCITSELLAPEQIKNKSERERKREKGSNLLTVSE